MTRTVSRYRWVILGLAFICELSNALAAQSVAPLAPLIQSELGLSRAEIGFFVSAAYVGAWGVLLLSGTLTDRFGLRGMLSLGQIATGALMLSVTMAGSFLQAAAVMVAAGLGRGVSSPGITKAITEWFPPRSRGMAVGFKQTGLPFAGIVTASTLPAFGLIWGWRSALALAGLIIVVDGVITALLYRDPGHAGPSAKRKGSMRADLAHVIGNAFLWKQAFMGFLLGTVQFTLTAHLTLYFTEVVLVPWVPDERARIVAAGGYLALCQAGGIFGRLFWGVVSDRVFQGQRVVVLSTIGFLMVFLSLATGYLDSGYPLWFVTATVFAYGATAIGWAGLQQVLATEIIGRKYAATAVGLTMTVSQIGKMGGPPLFGFVVDLTGSYRVAWIMLAFFSVGGTLLAFLNVKGEKHVA